MVMLNSKPMQLMGRLIMSKLIVSKLIVSKLIVSKLIVSKLIVSKLIIGKLIIGKLIIGKLIGKLSTTTNNSPSNTLGGLGSMINSTKRLAQVFFLAGLFAGLFTQAAHAVTVDTLATSDTTPEITGTLATGETLISVTVNGTATDTATIDASVTPTTWRAQVAVINALNEGTYEVVASVISGGGIVTDATTNELTVDTTAPTAPTVDALTTNDTTPEITGTTGTGASLGTGESLSVTVNGTATDTPIINTDGTWRAQVEVFNALGSGTHTVTAAVTDAAGNASSTTSSTVTVAADSIAPTATLAYTYGASTNIATRVSQGTSITITAAFSESIKASPVMRIAGTGAHTLAATNMTRVNATTYTYAWTVGAGNGTQTFTLSQGQDLAGNTVTATPTSGASINIDNIIPTATLAYTYGAGTNIATRVRQGTSITITAAFSEAMKGSPAMRIAGTGAHTVCCRQHDKGQCINLYLCLDSRYW